MHTVSSILTHVTGYRNSSVKKVRVNKQTGMSLSVHNLHIETGRHTRPVTPVNDQSSPGWKTIRTPKLRQRMDIPSYGQDGKSIH